MEVNVAEEVVAEEETEHLHADIQEEEVPEAEDLQCITTIGGKMAEDPAILITMQDKNGGRKYSVNYLTVNELLHKLPPSFKKLEQELKKWEKQDWMGRVSLYSPYSVETMGFYDEPYGKEITGTFTCSDWTVGVFQSILGALQKWDKKGWKVDIRKLKPFQQDIYGVKKSSQGFHHLWDWSY